MPHRIDTPDASNGLFVDGDPANKIVATQVVADYMNDLQENFLRFIEAQGITLVKGNYNQFTQAVEAVAGRGAIKTSIGNNQTDQAISTLTIDPTKVFRAIFDYDCYRKIVTGGVTKEYRATGKLDCIWYPNATNWTLIDRDRVGDDGIGLSFGHTENATNIGTINYTTTNLTGSDHVGALRFLSKTFSV